MSRSADSRIDDIEILRAVAVLGVILHHANGVLIEPKIEALDFGHFNLSAGVDLFFVISGFVIGRSFLSAQRGLGSRTRLRNALAFWTQRAFRLWPTAWLWLAIVLALSWAFNPKLILGSVQTNIDASVAGFFHFANVRFAEAFGQFFYGGTFHYWSLALEEQFYFALPILALIFRRWLPLALILLIVYDATRPMSLLVVTTRYTGLALGVLLAIWAQTRSYQWVGERLLKPLGIARFAFAVACLAMLTWLCGLELVRWKYQYMALAAAGAVLVASYDRDVLCPPGPLKDALIWMGARSYALYVVHVPIFLMSRGVWLEPDGPQQALAPENVLPAVLTAAFLVPLLAEANFRFVETPLRNTGKQLANRLRANPSAPQKEQAA